MSLTVSYKGNNIISETTDCAKVMKTAGKYLEDDIAIDFSGGGSAPVLTTKNIAANGTYAASGDNADGYSSVTVNVPDTAQALIARTIRSITIDEGLTTLRNRAFEGCSLLSSVVLPSTLTYIDGYAFDGCSSLSSVNIPGGVTTIYSCAFRSCSQLRRIVLPDNCTIFNSAFQGCSSLTEIDCTALTATGSTVNTVLNNTNAFSNTGGAPFVFASEAVMNVYKTAANWSSFAGRMTYVGA